ncbi:MAG: hypothetical protein JST61_01145 [Acidobacteria bacterium]|nr:hypothetical protein [Acidobacteriota bacterium]
MNTQQNRYSGPCAETKGPEVFYGYCHDTRRMRMMDYNDYVGNIQKGYTNLYQSPTSALQQMVDMAQAASTTATPTPTQQQPGKRHHGCRCHEEDDCGCECCIRCADTVEYARCGETRKILITFDNDSRRERQVTLEFGSFLTDSGQQLPWKGSLSDTTFTLPPCGEKTVAITVAIDCGQSGDTTDATGVVRGNAAALDSCKVGYATLKADGCLIRPIVVAVAVLPDRCGAHRVGCLCGCC